MLGSSACETLFARSKGQVSIFPSPVELLHSGLNKCFGSSFFQCQTLRLSQRAIFTWGLPDVACVSLIFLFFFFSPFVVVVVERAVLSMAYCHRFLQCMLGIIALTGEEPALDIERGIPFVLWLSLSCQGRMFCLIVEIQAPRSVSKLCF